MTYPYRFLARFVVEAKSPLAIGSGESNIMTDAMVATDVNGLPYIPATSLAGVLRGMIGERISKEIWGYQENEGGRGSLIQFTDAKIVKADGKTVVDGLAKDAYKDNILRAYEDLPIRQHAAIDAKGTTLDGGKFDNQVTYKGTRFCFEVEVISANEIDAVINQIKKALNQESFRIGGGTRKGYGEIKIISLKTAQLCLNKEDDLNAYLEKSSNLNKEWNGWREEAIEEERQSEDWIKYELELQPADFFLFGAVGTDESGADMTAITETTIEWEKNGCGRLVKKNVLIPASSVKGALRHRVAYHYNKKMKHFVTKDAPIEDYIGNKNEAVIALFGKVGEKQEEANIGNVLISDVLLQEDNRKMLNHVCIDRFTGGAIDGALFSENVVYSQQKFTLNILVKKTAIEKKEIRDAFESSLKDLVNEMLPLGGGVNRGNGRFYGKITPEIQ